MRKPLPVPPASGGRCGAQSPSSFARSRSDAMSAIASSSSRMMRGLVRKDVLLHERAVARAEGRDVLGRCEIGDGHGGSIAGMRLGFYMGYAPPGTNPQELIDLAREAERLGYASAWAAEAWGTDCVSVLGWLGATTTDDRLGSAIMQIPGRTPAKTAMTAATLDLLSGGRFMLGLGTSGPQVVEGWHGEPWGKPLGKTREYVEIVRAALRRERGRAPRGALRHAVLGRRRDGARQAAEADGEAARADDPYLPRRARAEGGRALLRDRRRMAPDLLVSGAGSRRVPGRPGARRVRHRGVRAGARHRRVWLRDATRSRSTTPSTWAAWAHAGRTSTTT